MVLNIDLSENFAHNTWKQRIGHENRLLETTLLQEVASSSALPCADGVVEASGGKSKRFLNHKKELYPECPHQAGGIWDGGIPARSTRPLYPSLQSTMGITSGGLAHHKIGGPQDHHSTEWCTPPATGASRLATGVVEGACQV